MSPEKRERLVSAGIDVDEALSRFLDNESLFERFLNKFLEDRNYLKLGEAIASGDNEAALAASHTLKGLCSNLSMKSLTELFTLQVKAYRAEDPDLAASMMPEISKAYDETVAAISE